MVSSPGYYYSFAGITGQNPTLALIRGQTYTFAIGTSTLHPFRINSPIGVTNNNINSGIIVFAVPTNAINYTYECSIHHFGGSIITVPPPVFRILSLSLGTNVHLRSVGTNWILTPEYSTNPLGSAWNPLTVQSNRFTLGTNETFCGRPPETNVFIRLKAVRK